jgi:hypothetical protein
LIWGLRVTHSTFASTTANSSVAIFSHSDAGIVEFATYCDPISPTSFLRVNVEYGAMSKQLGSITFVAALLIAGAGLQGSAALAAEECLSAPNARAPQGSHWHYRTDRATQQKCWYLRPPGETTQQQAPQESTELAPPAKSISAPASDVAAASSSPEMQVVPAADGSLQKAAQQVAPSPSATVKWPTPAPQVGVLKLEGAVAAPDETQADSTRQQQVADSQVAEFAQGDAQTTKPSPAAGNEPGGPFGLLTASPLGIFLIVAMALAMAGILSRIIMKIASARRNRVYLDHGEQDWIESIPPERAPSIAARPVDLAGAPAERVDRSENELETALRRFMRERDRRAA